MSARDSVASLGAMPPGYRGEEDEGEEDPDDAGEDDDEEGPSSSPHPHPPPHHHRHTLATSGPPLLTPSGRSRSHVRHAARATPSFPTLLPATALIPCSASSLQPREELMPSACMQVASW